MSSYNNSHQVNANLGNRALHAELDISKNALVNEFEVGSSIQNTTLISNDPRSVISQDQRIAANTPIITEKHVTQEFVPVIHEEIVTTIPVVTGSAVHTGQAIAGQSYVQQLGTQYVQQQSATKVDLIPEVQTQLGAQHMINISSNQQTQSLGKATVYTTQQYNQILTNQPIVGGGLNQLPLTQSMPLNNNLACNTFEQETIIQNQQLPLSNNLQQGGYLQNQQLSNNLQQGGFNQNQQFPLNNNLQQGAFNQNQLPLNNNSLNQNNLLNQNQPLSNNLLNQNQPLNNNLLNQNQQGGFLKNQEQKFIQKHL